MESSYMKGNCMTFPLEVTDITDGELTMDYHYLYPMEVQEIQKEIEEICDRMEYDGSYMYDIYPDKVQFEKISKKICKNCRCEHKEEISNRWLEALVQMMLCNEMRYRRRRRQCHKQNMNCAYNKS